ncbi:MAG: hypothetical protein JNL74_03405 [Fibrobacteres bacterium]|nr:hypothetical protein [Fibrobacterota bacterium]
MKNFLPESVLKALIISILCPLIAVAPLHAQFVDTVRTESAKQDSTAEQKYPIIKREVKVSDQIRIGTTIMVFVVLVMTLVNNYNPD